VNFISQQFHMFIVLLSNFLKTEEKAILVKQVKFLKVAKR